MTMLDRWASRFGLSDRSRRALSEAALDWQHEVATATTVTTRVVRHARAFVGFGRACLAVSAGELCTPLSFSWGSRIVASTLLVATLNIRIVLLLIDVGRRSDPSTALIDGWLILVSLIPAIFGLAVLTGDRRSPSPVPALAAVALVSAVAFWLCWAPLVNDLLGPRYRFAIGPIASRFPWMSLSLTVVFLLLADRLRLDPHRARSTVIHVLVSVGAVFVANLLANGLRAVGVPRNMGGELFIVFAAAQWLLIAQRQEREREVVH